MTHGSKMLALSFTLCAVVFITGCNDPVKAPPGGVVDAIPVANYPRVVASQGLQSALRFTEPIITRSATSPMLVTVPVRSIEDKYPINVQYLFEFYDAEGRLMKSTMGWRFLHLEPRVQAQMEANAMEIAAVDWRLIVRPAR